MSKDSSALEDIGTMKGYILGIIGITTAIAGFCTTIFGWDIAKVTAVALVAVVVFVMLAFLIQRSELRNMRRVEAQSARVDENMNEINQALTCLKDMALESQRSALRLEMNIYMIHEPSNHDTILAYAEKYFIELNGDWKETDKFLDWVEQENKANRSVHIPANLLSNVRAKVAFENKGV